MVTPNKNGAPAGELGAELAKAAEQARASNAGPEEKRGPGRPRNDGKPPGSGPSDGPKKSHHKKAAPGFKVKMNLPPQVLAAIALTPLGLFSWAAEWGLKLEAPPPPSEETQRNVVAAFAAYLDSIDFEMTPADALLFFYACGVAEISAVAIAEISIRTKARRAAEAEQKAKAAAGQVPTTPEPSKVPPDAPQG